jgi:hypothetical protein
MGDRGIRDSQNNKISLWEVTVVHNESPGPFYSLFIAHFHFSQPTVLSLRDTTSVHPPVPLGVARGQVLHLSSERDFQ